MTVGHVRYTGVSGEIGFAYKREHTDGSEAPVERAHILDIQERFRSAV